MRRFVVVFVPLRTSTRTVSVTVCVTVTPFTVEVELELDVLPPVGRHGEDLRLAGLDVGRPGAVTDHRGTRQARARHHRRGVR